MRTSRIFAPLPFEPRGLLSLEGETSHYLKTVLRLRKGFKVTLFDGNGNECPATIESFGRDVTYLRLEDPRRVNRESPLSVWLALGISRGERMDLAVQKAVELGVHRITPLLTEYCVVRLEDGKREIRHAHWQRIVRSALEQCGRNQMPLLDPPMVMEDWLESRETFGPALVLNPKACNGLAQIGPVAHCLTLLIGPEGGLSEMEIERTVACGFEAVQLGPRVLRTETAVIAAISSVQTLWGDLGRASP